MTTHIARVIPKQQGHGSCDIPKSAWKDLQRELLAEFGAGLIVHDHAKAGRYHGRADLPPHYYVEAVFPGEKSIDAVVPVMAFMEPRIGELISKYTQVDVPQAR
jgi:hypothetical protein